MQMASQHPEVYIGIKLCKLWPIIPTGVNIIILA